ncbi:MAG: hypothetical protein A2511_03810 [Deltaproteobacteria bacterium RIFOXYD12_FULL_50_9]|nr:MAG: hypothetical protein A2511_03810 [Deltaproteobacteria bacterium RIFOXYD12_FULL_50_9]
MKQLPDATNGDCVDQLLKELGFSDPVRPMNTPEAFVVLGFTKKGRDTAMDLLALYGFSGSSRSH